MIRLALIFIFSSCAFLGLKKFDASDKGLRKAVVAKSKDIKKCSFARPPWHKHISYRVKLSVVIDKNGGLYKTYVQSIPALGPGMKRCLMDSFNKVKFKEPKSKKASKFVQVFKIKSLSL